MDEVENFFCQFPNPWALRVSGMGGYTSKSEKSQNHCTLVYTTGKMVVFLVQEAVESFSYSVKGRLLKYVSRHASFFFCFLKLYRGVVGII